MTTPLQARYIAALIKLGAKPVKTTHRFKVYSRPTGGFYYVGKGGSLRIGNTIASSIPVNPHYRKMLLDNTRVDARIKFRAIAAI
jgi:hypothetical protein